MRGTLFAIAIAGGVVVVLRYVVWHVIIRPFRDCWLCKVRGYFRSKRNRKLSRGCRRCRYTGKRLRFGRRLWNRARRTTREANVRA